MAASAPPAAADTSRAPAGSAGAQAALSAYVHRGHEERS